MHSKSSSVKHTTRTSKTEERHKWCNDVFVAMRTVALQGYLNVVGVDVIWAHNIGIGILQDDPGVVDLSWWERERENKTYLMNWLFSDLVDLRLDSEKIKGSQGRMFLYLFLLLFSGLWPSSRLFFTFASHFWRVCRREAAVYTFIQHTDIILCELCFDCGGILFKNVQFSNNITISNCELKTELREQVILELCPPQKWHNELINRMTGH